MGTITGRADFVLREPPARRARDMDYRGSGVIGGPLARLDSRFAERLAESLIDQGLRALDAASRHGGLRVTVSHYYLPASVPEALGLLAEHGPELLVMAGGTVAMPLINEGISLPARVMGLRRAGLDRIERVGDELHIGATTTLTRLAEQDDVPLLRQAASRTASWSIRNMATVGGNLFTPPPGGDVATALLALDARVVVTGPAGPRILPLADSLDRLHDDAPGRRRAGHLDRGPAARPAGRRSSSSGARRPTRPRS